MPYPAFDYQAFGCYLEATTEVFVSGVGLGPATGQFNCVSGATLPTWPDVQLFPRGLTINNPLWWEVAQGSVLLQGSAGIGGPYTFNTPPTEQRVSGNIFRRGWPVPLKVRWEEVETDMGTFAEVSRTPFEYVIGSAATSVAFTITIPSSGNRIDLENVQLVTPVMGSY